MLALSQPRATYNFGPLLSLPPSFAISTSLPESALETWRDSIGRLHVAELSEESLFLWATAPSQHPEVLDEENESLQRQVYRLYLGLLVAVPWFSHSRVTSLTGAHTDATRVRSLTTYPRTFYTLGSPMPVLSVQRARAAAQLAAALAKHDDTYGQGRFVRTLRTFREACEAGNLDDRLHQFVRAAEGFAVPPFKNSRGEFARRLKRICSGRALAALKELYTIRSGIEHLHGPYERLPRMAKRARWIRLLRRCFEAEGISRYLLHVYLDSEQLWQHFNSVATIEVFWALKARAFAKLWPTHFPYSEISKTFDLAALESHSTPS